jgi:hypothetical protein
LHSFKDGAGGYTPLSIPFSPLMASSSFLQELVQAVFEFLLEDIECRWPCVVTAVFFYFDHQVAVLTIVVELFL